MEKTLPVSQKVRALKEIEDELIQLSERNKARVEAMKASMGEKYVLHPKHAPSFKRAQHL